MLLHIHTDAPCVPGCRPRQITHGKRQKVQNAALPVQERAVIAAAVSPSLRSGTVGGPAKLMFRPPVQHQERSPRPVHEAGAPRRETRHRSPRLGTAGAPIKSMSRPPVQRPEPTPRPVPEAGVPRKETQRRSLRSGTAGGPMWSMFRPPVQRREPTPHPVFGADAPRKQTRRHSSSWNTAIPRLPVLSMRPARCAEKRDWSRLGIDTP